MAGNGVGELELTVAVVGLMEGGIPSGDLDQFYPVINMLLKLMTVKLFKSG